ncbi:MAG: tyrosine--tRNA ligase [Candidatus Doudnabacteria bacterium]|nr:tyrosine--tRNA ligase [Candidatus Doudnabacteria bacterium]
MTAQDLLTRGVAEIIDRKHLEQQLGSGKKLRVKLGIDPTGAKLHLGHAVPLWKLRSFQELGHKVVLVIGDFTGLIGDTSDKESERPMLTEKQVADNMKDYFHQASKILDKDKLELRYNSEWLKPLGFLEIAKQANLFGLHEFLSRENIARRLKAGKNVSLREALYPLMQGYDSVAVKADVELGAIDQRFNLLTGRTLQKFYNQESQDIITLKYLMGTDGRKMSKSWGNVINISDEADDMFGKVMSIEDKFILEYLELATQVPMNELRQIEKELKTGANPRDIKKRLAEEIVTLYHGKKSAATASKEWAKVFSQKEKPSEIPKKKIQPGSYTVSSLLVAAGLAGSKSEARRLIDQGGVKIADGIIKHDKRLWEIKGNDNLLLQVGKRKFVKIV